MVIAVEPSLTSRGVDAPGREIARAKDADTDFNIYFNAVDADPANGDFSFKPGSPAMELGIVPIDRSEIGLRERPAS